MLKGDVSTADSVDEGKAAEQAKALHAELEDTGMWRSMDEGPPSLIRIVGGNSFAQNAALARVYEDAHDVSLGTALSDKCGKKLGLALRALLLPKADVLAARLKQAMEGWGSDGSALVRILAGVDSAQLAAVATAYERK